MLLAPVGAVRIRRAKQAAQKQKTSNRKASKLICSPWHYAAANAAGVGLLSA
jgi:hypothetical protein